MNYLEEFKADKVVVHIRNANQKNQFMLQMESLGYFESSMHDGEQYAVIAYRGGCGITCYYNGRDMCTDDQTVVSFEDFMKEIKGGTIMNENNKSETIYTRKMIEKMGIDEILYKDNATIVVLLDGRKGVSVVDRDDDPTRLVGIAVAYAYAMGTDGSKTQFKKNMIKINKHQGYKK